MNALERAMINESINAAKSDFYSNNMDAIMEAVQKMHPYLKALTGNALVAELHNGNDAIQRTIDFKNVTQCDKQQCSFCCHSEIFITQHEADYIKATGKYEIDQERLEKQRAAKSYNDLSFADRACIMLKDGKCQVYASRPLLCRNHGVVAGTNPEECHEQNLHNGTVFLNEPKTILNEAITLYIPVTREHVLNMKNIADFDW